MSIIDNKLNVFEQKLNTLHTENLYLREVFNHKINALEERLTSKLQPSQFFLESNNNNTATAITPYNSNRAHTQKPKQTQLRQNSLRSTPSLATLEKTFQLSSTLDKPILTDYWQISGVCIGIKLNGVKLLVKSAEEYTSPIVKIYKINNEFVVETENSIYIVENSIPIRKVTGT